MAVRDLRRGRTISRRPGTRYASNGNFHNDPWMWWLIKIACVVYAFWRHPLNGNVTETTLSLRIELNYIFERHVCARYLISDQSSVLYGAAGFIFLRMFVVLSDGAIQRTPGDYGGPRADRDFSKRFCQNRFAEHQRPLTRIKVCRSDRIETIKLIHFVLTSVAGHERSIRGMCSNPKYRFVYHTRSCQTPIWDTETIPGGGGHDAGTETFFKGIFKKKHTRVLTGAI